MDHERHQVNSPSTGQNDSPEEIRGNIQHTRDEIGKTVNTIQERLSPERIKEQMKSAAREGMESVKKDVRLKADRWRTQVEARISNNPIPATMVGLGLLWIFLNAQESRKRMYNRPFRYSYSLDPYEDWPDYAPELASGRAAHLPHTNHGPVDALKTKVQTTGQQTREQVSQLADQAQESLSEWKSKAHQQTNQMKEHAREQGERAKGEFQRLLQDNPLAIGAMTLAIGTAIGLSLPRSEKEDQWLGETRDRLFEEAKETVQGIIPKAKEFAGEFQQAAGDSLREKAGMR